MISTTSASGISSPAPVENNPFDLGDNAAYFSWRDRKILLAERAQETRFIEISDPESLSGAEREQILSACDANNMAFYHVPALRGDETSTRRAIAALVSALGLREFEDHRSAGGDGIVPIEVADAGGRAGFIPYSTRAINWHTDGYYSYRSPDRMIRSMILHCVRDAETGGENGFLDHEIAYIRLRDRDPAFIKALMHDQAMVIPPFDDGEGKSHPAVVGPVFVVMDGKLSMRFTIRKRNIEWRDDDLLSEARAVLAEILADDPLVKHARLAPDQGLICNNVLHERKAFTNKDSGDAGRLLYRVRSYDRIGG